ncbi:MAG: glycoside hydrolase domain-containing protein [Mycobacterium sp.]
MIGDLAIDYAWTHPDPAVIKAAGYKGVIRYLSHDPSKNLTTTERDGLHGEGLWILLVWEDSAAAALGGANAGNAHGIEAAKQAAALGYPTSVPLFHAVDFDAQPSQMRAVLAYGDAFATHWQTGPYGGKNVIDGATAKWRWQASAWSRGILSPSASLFQRLRPTLTLPGSFDENVVLAADLPVWQPPGTLQGDEMASPYLIRTPDGEIDLVLGAALVHLTPAELAAYSNLPVVPIGQDEGNRARAKFGV